MLPVPVVEHRLHGLPLKIFLRSTKVAGNERKATNRGISINVFLFAVGQWTNHDMRLVIAEELGGHGLEAAAIEEIEKKGLNDVVTVMPQGDLGDPVVLGEAIKVSPPKP